MKNKEYQQERQALLDYIWEIRNPQPPHKK